VHPARQQKKYRSFLTGRIDQREEILKLTEDNEKFTTDDGYTNVTDLATYGGTVSLVPDGGHDEAGTNSNSNPFK
jgi:hypothetical protein